MPLKLNVGLSKKILDNRIIAHWEPLVTSV